MYIDTAVWALVHGMKSSYSIMDKNVLVTIVKHTVLASGVCPTVDGSLDNCLVAATVEPG